MTGRDRNEIHVYLKIVGYDDLDGLSTHLGLAPTRSWVRGDLRGRWTASYSAWILDSPTPLDDEPEDRLAGLLDRLEPCREALAQLPAGAEAELVIAAYWREGHNPGFRLPAAVARRAARLNLDIDLDIYCLADTSHVEVENQAR